MSRGVDDSFTLFFLAHDILEYNDRVIDEHANGERDTAERHDVERNIVQIHQQERANDRNGNCDSCNRCGPGITQESVQHDDGDDTAENCRVSHVIHGRRNELRLVVDRDDFDFFGQGLLERRESSSDSTRHLHGIGITLFVYRELDRLPATNARNSASRSL